MSAEVVTKLDYSHIDGCRNVYALLALPDKELEKVDVLELNMAVAREIPGLEKLDYAKYRDILDDWTAQFTKWCPSVEYAFHQRPTYYKNDINFFRLGMLAQFLDDKIGVKYIEEQKGLKEIRYTNPADLLLFGLIDRKQGTCGSMPTLHVSIGRRLGWPVTLACVKSHYLCRYDDGKVTYNIEATDTGRGGFGAGVDQEYLERGQTTKQAVDCGSDLRSLSAREMIGVFVGLRARHYYDIDKIDLAERDCLLARSLIPNYRRLYAESVEPFLRRGGRLFTPDEHGHPRSIVRFINGELASLPQAPAQGAWQRIPQSEIDRQPIPQTAGRQPFLINGNPQSNRPMNP